MTYDPRNPGPDLVQAQRCGKVNPFVWSLANDCFILLLMTDI